MKRVMYIVLVWFLWSCSLEESLFLQVSQAPHKTWHLIFSRSLSQDQLKKYIVAAEIREEATEEEISNVASLAKMCLMLRGTDRPTMKEVE